jgi:hypothetical protein
MTLAFDEIHPHEKGFGTFFSDEIAPILEDVEAARLEARKSFNTRLFICVLAAVPAGLALYVFSSFFFHRDTSDLTGWGAVAAIGGAIWWVNQPRRKFLVAFKQRILRPIAEFLGFDFSHDGRDLCAGFSETGILHDHDEREYEDGFAGAHRGVEISFEEVKLIDVSRDSKGRQRRTTVFDGVAAMMRMNKRFNGHTVIKEDRGKIGNWLTDAFNEFEKVELEDPRFEDRFEVYSNDQVEARYLLTPAFMERLFAVSEAFDNAKLRASFRNDRLYLLIPYGSNLFEAASLRKTVLETDGLRKVLGQIESLRGIIDVLKLNEKLGL